ncbi:MAG TPA: sterol desaturase family protein [Rhizomicrobium sp.]|jgi:sterol desaturase/sphingolipid hydroxylase (fatty acid hydroxylase superfamily)|nr:sterol desaturase family protein [Rhizomicrobium sp.]
MTELGHRIIGLVIAFAVLTVLYAVIARLWPSVPGQKILRRGFWTDCLYWLWTPIVTKAVTPVAIAIAVLPLIAIFGWHYKTLAQGHGPLAIQPLWLQAIEIFVIGDFFGYWQHRMFHRTRLWRFHAVHHSSSDLDWLSSVRLHPVNDIGAKLIQAVPLVALGFNLGAVALYAPVTTFYAIMVHANLSWDLGPFRAVFVSPAFHRWHHTKAEEGLDKNFAGGLPLWDILFGTYYMPRRQPTVFGIDDPMPQGFLGQMLQPFRPTAPQTQPKQLTLQSP